MERTVQAFAAAQRILDEIKEETGFSFETYDDVENILEDLRYNYGMEKVYFEWGASRVVFYDDNNDYAIKIAREQCFEKYNEREVEIYADAETQKLEENFGWCKCYIEPTEETPGIYVMEFLDGDEEDVTSRAYQYGYSKYCETYGLDTNEDSAESYQSEVDEKEELMYLLHSYMTEKEVSAFENFVYSWDISDLHSGNMLYRNERLVICDYAGWGW